MDLARDHHLDLLHGKRIGHLDGQRLAAGQGARQSFGAVDMHLAGRGGRGRTRQRTHAEGQCEEGGAGLETRLRVHGSPLSWC